MPTTLLGRGCVVPCRVRSPGSIPLPEGRQGAVLPGSVRSGRRLPWSSLLGLDDPSGRAAQDGPVGEDDREVVAVTGDGDTGPVLLAMVVAAQQTQVLEIGCSAVFPRDQMISVAPGAGDVAVLDTATPVTGEQRPILGFGRVAENVTPIWPHSGSQ